ncbi:multisubunit sodium/proton antiporter, MrpC subunit [Austwickia chelonae]|uniref:Na(+)/H(+) antiporter subunit C n=1 Tax=Austwickia chelonae NBRC 105200 TaxID=1184607 RepID=K6UND8_9MICO|nr:Na(+)/H(+) antiporter subunit C [Austwickia chelonae]GAB78896.1 Na(+)/H(+) antiporter subunit C [Austwickia chelonae NBRC 105200]SEV86081.1 multisubunit sodium/proton antiporter, MrpC subunit [Austwickia chelonae]
MTANLTLAVLTGVLVGCGVSLVMARGIVRSFLGILLMGNGVNLLFLIASGRAGRAPIVGTTGPEKMSDPLPQAMVLTAIVITLALTGFVLALAHRSWQLARSDVIVDDTEDARIHAKAAENDMSDSEFAADEETDPAEDPDPGGHRRRGVATRPEPPREEGPR